MSDRNDEYRPGDPAANPTPRSGRAQGQGTQQPHAAEGSGRYSQGSHEHGSYGGREAGEGYGRSSGYGSPEQDRYAGGSNYRGTSFVSPADTQLGHSGLGRQNYSGMGPKNYKRSDERITEDLCERLTQDHDIDASELEVRIADGTATLEGNVPQRWMKHRAEDLADGCAGVRNIENRIKVQSAGTYSGPPSQRDTSKETDTLGSQSPNPSPSPRTGGPAH